MLAADIITTPTTTTMATPTTCRRSQRLKMNSLLSSSPDSFDFSSNNNAKTSPKGERKAAKRKLNLAVDDVPVTLVTPKKNSNRATTKEATPPSRTTSTPTKTKKTKRTLSKSEETKPRNKNNDVNKPRRKKRPTEKPITYSHELSKINSKNKWIDLNIPPGELRPSATLTTGQSFVWTSVVAGSTQSQGENNTSDNTVNNKSAWGTHDATEWYGAIGQQVFSIRETPTTTFVRLLNDGLLCSHNGNDSIHSYEENDIVNMFHDYFQISIPLLPLYEEWSSETGDPNRLARIAEVIPGVRIIRQNPIECMFSFICSSNNNIPRITLMLSRLRERYGTKLMDIPTSIAEDGNDISSSDLIKQPLYSFPTLEQLKDATEAELREMGLGYRAKYIISTRDLLIEKGGEKYLMELRNHKDPVFVQQELCQFMGIGPKVADCIALFSLDQSNAIPVDVHVLNIANRDYDTTLLDDVKSVTPKLYKRVGDLFRSRFPKHAGWAHSLLFVAELPSFRPVLPVDIVEEMDKWRETEKEKKKRKAK